MIVQVQPRRCWLLAPGLEWNETRKEKHFLFKCNKQPLRDGWKRLWETRAGFIARGRILFLGEKKGGEDFFGAEKGGECFFSKENTMGQYFFLFWKKGARKIFSFSEFKYYLLESYAWSKLGILTMLAGEGSLSVFSGPRTFFESERGAENFLRKQ